MSITINVERDGLTGQLQLSINDINDDGYGHGYRIAGPKYNGTGETLLSAPIDNETAERIRAYLDQVPR